MTVADHTPDDAPTGPYARAAAAYWQAGWRGILPLPPRAKKPVPEGWTGARGAWPSYADVHAWTEEHPDGNLALRLPHHVIGIDVDSYDGKAGAATLAGLVDQYGPLPATWRSTSRDDGTSGIALYRVPEGLAWPGVLGAGIEVIQYRHRYAVAWPSVHPDTGRTYRWINPDGHDVIGDVPHVDHLPDLPETWVAGITRGEAAGDTPRVELPDVAVRAWLDARAGAEGEQPCREVAAALARYTADLANRAGARHDIALAATARLAHLAAEGHRGVATALRGFKTAWTAATADRGDDLPAEWNRLLTGAVKIAAADPQHMTDPCDNPFHGILPTTQGDQPWMTGSMHGSSTPSEVSPETSNPSPASPEASTSGMKMTTSATASTAESSTPTDDGGLLTLAGQQLLDQEIAHQRIRRLATRLLDDEEAASQFREPVWRATLADELAIPDEPVSYLVDDVFPTGANVLLTAQFKAGKTTLVNHLTGCLADGDPFLGVYGVHGPARRIALWNYEVDERQYRRWLRDLNIAHPERVTVLNLRGYRLPLVTSRVEDWVVAWLERHEIDVWVVDPFARAFTGSGDSENDNTQVGRFLDALDVIKHRAGVSELVMPTHTGRGHMDEGQERARGATRLDDWADVRWLLTKDDEDVRYFRATGRDVEVPEGRLSHDPATRSLTLDTGQSRRTKAVQPVMDAVLDAVRITPGIGSAALRAYCRNALGTASSQAVDQAVRTLENQGRLRVEKAGKGLPTRHYEASVHDLLPASQGASEDPESITLPDLAEPCHGKVPTTLPPTRRGGKVGKGAGTPADDEAARSTVGKVLPGSGQHCASCGVEVPAYILDIGQTACPDCRRPWRAVR